VPRYPFEKEEKAHLFGSRDRYVKLFTLITLRENVMSRGKTFHFYVIPAIYMYMTPRSSSDRDTVYRLTFNRIMWKLSGT